MFSICGKVPPLGRQGNSLCMAFLQHFLHIPYPVSGWRGYVDSQRSLEFLHLHGEQKRRVRDFLHLLFDELCFCGLLEVFGFGDLVHKAHDLAGFVASNQTAFNKKRVRVKVT